jgi:hypothetical protein
MSESCVTGPRYIPGEPGPVLLLKLHGSVNWRIPLGHPTPYAVDGIMHHEAWFKYFDRQKIPLDAVEQFLETDPLLVPPVLTKTDLVQQPILRLTWSLAVNALKRSKSVVFIGYSLPLTDIAAAFLFREGCRHLDQAAAITVVDFARDEQENHEKLAALRASYRNVFPGISPEQFVFSGAAEWVRNSFTQWLYDSQGNPVAFKAVDHVFSRNGRFIGEIREYYPGRQDPTKVRSSKATGSCALIPCRPKIGAAMCQTTFPMRPESRKRLVLFASRQATATWIWRSHEPGR